MVLNVHAGHNPDGKTACGAVGLIKESTEARAVKELAVARLRALGHTVYDCTCDNGTGQTDVLRKIVAKCNAHTADLDVSIHFNSGANDSSGNGQTTGTEVLVYQAGNTASGYAARIAAAIAALGFKNRGVKARPDLYVLKHTKAPALLVECCFVDDADDVKLYNADQMAAAIVQGITGQSVSAATAAQTAAGASTSAQTANSTGCLVRITAAALNVRADHSASSKVVTTVRKGEVYTIVEEYNNAGTLWGKLKSGAGWIALGYTERV